MILRLLGHECGKLKLCGHGIKFQLVGSGENSSLPARDVAVDKKSSKTREFYGSRLVG